MRLLLLFDGHHRAAVTHRHACHGLPPRSVAGLSAAAPSYPPAPPASARERRSMRRPPLPRRPQCCAAEPTCRRTPSNRARRYSPEHPRVTISATVPLPRFLITHLARQCEGKDRDDRYSRAMVMVATCAPPPPPVGMVCQSHRRIRRAARYAARSPPHRSQPRRERRSQRQGAAEDARACLGGDDSRHLHRLVRRRSGRGWDRIG